MESPLTTKVKASKFVSKLYGIVKPHISLVNDMVVFAKFINTSYSILVLLHPSELLYCMDYQPTQVPGSKFRSLCQPHADSGNLYEAYLYTFIFNIGLFIFSMYLSRWYPLKKYAELISVCIIVVTLLMLMAKLFMVFYVPVIQVNFPCPTVGTNFSTPYCTDVEFVVNGYPVNCSDQCFVQADTELFLLGTTLILSFLYICFLIYCYATNARDALAKEEEEKAREKERELVSGTAEDAAFPVFNERSPLLAR